MNENPFVLIDRLAETHSLSVSEYQTLVLSETETLRTYAAQKADKIRRDIYGDSIYIRGLIEVSNVCRNDCYYCGIRASNRACDRYLLTDDQILSCCAEGYALGFRTFVMQGGEGGLPVARVCSIVTVIKTRYPDCAVTLSLGEYQTGDYQRMYDAGADRYLLRHETADKTHYQQLHPQTLSFDNRMRCLYDLKRIGFQVGCGFMFGSPYQTPACLAKDLAFIEAFRPDMCGIGPFIPQKDTPFRDFPAGSAHQTAYLLSLIRLIQPNILLPATTALGTILASGQALGIQSGANVIMPNLSPLSEREKYALYDNKRSAGTESAQNLADLKASMQALGYRIVTARGDIIHPSQSDGKVV